MRRTLEETWSLTFKRVAKYWEISMNFDEEKSKEGDDWAEYVWIIKVKSKNQRKHRLKLIRRKF